MFRATPTFMRSSCLFEGLSDCRSGRARACFRPSTSRCEEGEHAEAEDRRPGLDCRLLSGGLQGHAGRRRALRPPVSRPQRRGRHRPARDPVRSELAGRGTLMVWSGNGKVYRGRAPCLAEAPSILKGGDHVKFIIATLTTFAVTATGIVPAPANCCP